MPAIAATMANKAVCESADAELASAGPMPATGELQTQATVISDVQPGIYRHLHFDCTSSKMQET
jgi:hypothetical protein